MRELQGAVTRLAAMQMIDPQRSAYDDPGQLLMPGFNDAQDRIIGQAAVQPRLSSTQWAPETPVPIGKVVDVVARRTGVTRAELASSSRHQRISLARGLVAYLGAIDDHRQLPGDRRRHGTDESLVGPCLGGPDCKNSTTNPWS